YTDLHLAIATAQSHAICGSNSSGLRARAHDDKGALRIPGDLEIGLAALQAHDACLLPIIDLECTVGIQRDSRAVLEWNLAYFTESGDIQPLAGLLCVPDESSGAENCGSCSGRQKAAAGHGRGHDRSDGRIRCRPQARSDFGTDKDRPCTRKSTDATAIAFEP